jgi:hypothetical protein
MEIFFPVHHSHNFLSQGSKLVRMLNEIKLSHTQQQKQYTVLNLFLVCHKVGQYYSLLQLHVLIYN